MRRLHARTLRARLRIALLVPLVALALVGAAIDDATVRRLTDESYDRALASTAIGLAARVETDRDDDRPAHLEATASAVNRLSAGADLHYLVLDGEGQRISGEPRLAALIAPPGGANPAFVDAMLAAQPVRVATYRYVGPDGRATIVVAEPLAARTRAAHRVVLYSSATNVAMAAAVVVLATLAVRFALRPLDLLGARVGAHEVDRLRPISLRGIPLETRPLVRAINRLMSRVRRAAEQRQGFIDSTAHQLRTPLAGLQAEAELLLSEPLPAPAAEHAARMHGSVQRLAHLAQRMLALARASNPGAGAREMQPVQLPALLEDIASARLDAALARGIDLGFEPAEVTILGSPWMLRELLANLVDNAIAHAGEGCIVTVRCGLQPQPPGGAYLEVEDDGPGIAAADRARVFERFVRLGAGGGTGLGLAIVREIAARHGARVELEDGAGGRGTRVRVAFPPDPAPSGRAAYRSKP